MTCLRECFQTLSEVVRGNFAYVYGMPLNVLCANKIYDPYKVISFPVYFSGYSSVTLYLTDTDGAVMRYAGNFSAVNGFSFFGGNDFG